MVDNKHKIWLLVAIILLALIGVFAFNNNQLTPQININNKTNSDSSYNYVDTTNSYKNASTKIKNSSSKKTVQNTTPTPTPTPTPKPNSTENKTTN
jgi:cytoskeletal protein RodZ